MKTAKFFLQSSYLLISIILCTLTAGLSASISEADSARYQLITVELTAQGESFTGTILEKNEEGWFPLSEGAQISIQGQIVTAKAEGRVDIPPVPVGTCGQSLPIEILSDGEQPGATKPRSIFRASPITLIPVVPHGETTIHAVPRLIKPGGFLTVTGQGLNQVLSGRLRAADGAYILLQEAAGSSIQRKYRIPPDLPEGSYLFEAGTADGRICQAPAVSTYPRLEMNGPALKKIGQKGKIRIRAGADGTLAVWGGLPQIELIPDRSMQTGVRTGGQAVILVEATAGEWIDIPFVARAVGQYTISVELSETEAARNDYGTPLEADLLSTRSSGDFVHGTTRVEMEVLVRELTGAPAAGRKVEVMITYPGGTHLTDGTSDLAGLTTIETTLPGAWPENTVTAAAFRPAEGAWRQEPLFSAQSASAFFSLIDQNGEQAEQEEADALAEMYRRNKRQWGNYQGICGTALMEMCRLYPDQCEQFKKSEAAIEEWLNGRGQKNSPEREKSLPGSSRPAHAPADPARTRQVSGPGARPDQEAAPAGEGEGDNAHPIPEEDRAELEDGVVKRAFEENDVVALRILEIRLGHLGAAVTRIGDRYVITYDKKVVFDPETGRPVDYWDFNEAQPLTADEWYAIYLLSLGDRPLNLLSRIVESAESLGKSFLADLFKDMKEKDDITRRLEVEAEHLMLLYVTASFDQGAMPQLGDHYRAAETHMNNALAAAERGDWTTALVEWQAAQSSMAWLALEVLPGAGAAGKAGGRAGRRALIEVTQDATRNLDEVAEALRKAAKSETNQDLARQMSRRADEMEEMAERSGKLNRITDLGQPRPANFPVAARDRGSLEDYFGRDNVRRVGNRKPENVLEVVDADGRKQVWARPDYSDYKGAYESVHGPIPAGLDVNVDHLQSRARAGQQGYGYVRLELVNSDVNQAWGRHMEKRTVNAGRQGFVEPSGPAPIRHIDQFQWWKLQGISPGRVDDWMSRLGR